MKGKKFSLVVIGLIGNMSILLHAQSLAHPIIWVTPKEQAALLSRISQYDWAKSLNAQLHTHVDAKKTGHLSNPAALLNTIPAWGRDRKKHSAILTLGAESGMLYFLTGDEAYAQMSADILSAYTLELATKEPRTVAIGGDPFMAGGTGLSWYHGGNYPEGDGDCEDFTQRSELFRFTRYALKFLRGNEIPLQRMRNRQDLLVDENARRCLALEGSVYVVQLQRGADSASLKLGSCSSNSRFSIQWFDPCQGATLTGSVSFVQGGADVSIGVPPHGTEHDWIALVQQTK